MPKKWRDTVRKWRIRGQCHARLQSSSAQAARYLPLAKAGTNPCSVLQGAGGWEHCHCWDQHTGNTFARECFTQVDTLGVWGTGSSQQQGNGRESFSWLLAGGKEDPGTETKAGPALFGDQQRGGRWGRGGRLRVCLREESANKSLGLKIRSSVSPVGCEVEFANVICWDRKIQTVYL